MITNFIKTEYSENYVTIFFESANTSFRLYLYYLQTIMKAHFNSFCTFSLFVIDFVMSDERVSGLDMLRNIKKFLEIIYLIYFFKRF